MVIKKIKNLKANYFAFSNIDVSEYDEKIMQKLNAIVHGKIIDVLGIIVEQAELGLWNTFLTENYNGLKHGQFTSPYNVPDFVWYVDCPALRKAWIGEFNYDDMLLANSQINEVMYDECFVPTFRKEAIEELFGNK